MCVNKSDELYEVESFLERQKLPKLTQELIENFRRTVTRGLISKQKPPNKGK